MLKQNSELRAEARVALTDKWVMGAVTTLVFGAVSGAASYIPVVGTILVALPMMYGYSIVMLSVMRGGEMNKVCLMDSMISAVLSVLNCFRLFIHFYGRCCSLFLVLLRTIRMQ